MSKITQAGLSLGTPTNASDAATKSYVDTAVAGVTGGLTYKGLWNANTNSPSLTSGVGTLGWFYKVGTAGTTTLDGNSVWNVGDILLFDGTSWDKIEGPAEAVTSVAGRTGAVVLTTSDVSEGSNLYHTNARTIASTLTGYTSGAGTVSSADSVLGAIQKLNGNIAALPAVPTNGQEVLTLNSTDIANGYKDLAQIVKANSLTVCVQSWGGLEQTSGVDYTLSTVSSKTRITFAGDMTSLVNTNVIQATYQY